MESRTACSSARSASDVPGKKCPSIKTRWPPTIEDVEAVNLTGPLVEAPLPAAKLASIAVGEVDVGGDGQLDHLSL